MKRFIQVLCLGFAAGILAETQAQLLVPGGSVTPVNQPAVGGVVFSGPFSFAFTDGANLSGTLTSTAIAAEPGNPNGGLTFVYEIANLGADSIDAISIPGFSGLILNVAENGSDATHFAPGLANRSAAPGDIVSYFFASIPTGLNSSSLLNHTDASGLAVGAATIFSAGFASSASTTALVPVPEPAEYAVVFGFGLLGVAAWHRCRKTPSPSLT